MRPPVRPPQLRCVFFSSMYLPHLLVLPATFWTSVPFATLSVFPSLICGSCPSGQRFAYSFFQIPSHGGHPCCSAMCFVVAYAHLGLSPIRKRPCWANKKAADKTLSTAAKKQTAVYWKIRKQNSKTSNLESNSCRLLFSYFQAPYNVLKYQIVRSYNQCRTYRITLHSPFPLHIIVIIDTHGRSVKRLSNDAIFQ